MQREIAKVIADLAKKAGKSVADWLKSPQGKASIIMLIKEHGLKYKDEIKKFIRSLKG
jgi:hypothetical protein